MRMFSEKMDMERKKVQEACREEVSGLVKQVLLEFFRKFICSVNLCVSVFVSNQT